jgi:hypothetical protein
MLLGVLRMPPECWIDSPIDVKQRHSRYLEAANRIEEMQKKAFDDECVIRDLLVRIADQNDLIRKMKMDNDDLQRKTYAKQSDPYIKPPYVASCYGYYGKP